MEFSNCPKCHSRQQVVAHERGGGTDPTDIEVLACGHQLAWFADDFCSVVGFDRKVATRSAYAGR